MGNPPRPPGPPPPGASGGTPPPPPPPPPTGAVDKAALDAAAAEEAAAAAKAAEEKAGNDEVAHPDPIEPDGAPAPAEAEVTGPGVVRPPNTTPAGQGPYDSLSDRADQARAAALPPAVAKEPEAEAEPAEPATEG